MPGVRDIKRRIRSVNSTRQITKAMKMVSAAKLRKTQGAVVASRPYAHKLDEVLGRIVASARETAHPLMTQREVNSAGIILFTADRGLAGGYNANLVRKAMADAARLGDTKTAFVTAGRKGRDFMRRRGKTITADFSGINDTPSISEAREIAKKAVDLYLNGTFDAVYLIYQEFVSVVSQRPVIKQLLPIPFDSAKEDEQSEYLYEPEPEKVLETLLPKYIDNVIFQALMEAKTSEHGARMTAMSSATDNAGEMIDKLTLSFNQARQAAITREISEIVGGANALKG